MITIVCGGRDFNMKSRVFSILDSLEFQISELHHGDAPGVDTLAGQWAIARQIPWAAHPAEWNGRDLSAGLRRNTAMLKDSGAQMCVGIWDGFSTGTCDMLKKSQKAGLKVFAFDYDGSPRSLPPIEQPKDAYSGPRLF